MSDKFVTMNPAMPSPNAALASRAEKIVSVLEHDIDSGLYLPGHFLDERTLADRFGVSRTPIREALQRLAAAGLVQIVPRQGVFVARMSLSELREMLELVSELEGSCAKFCATRMHEPWKDAMQQAVKACHEAAVTSDWLAFTQANANFHNAIYEGSRNRHLAEQARSARRRTQVYRLNAFQSPGRMQISAAEHAEIAAAICTGDQPKAQELMLKHVNLGGSGFGDFISRLRDDQPIAQPHETAYPPAAPIAAT